MNAIGAFCDGNLAGRQQIETAFKKCDTLSNGAFLESFSQYCSSFTLSLYCNRDFDRRADSAGLAEGLELGKIEEISSDSCTHDGLCFFRGIDRNDLSSHDLGAVFLNIPRTARLPR
jgi:hypothetical protein